MYCCTRQSRRFSLVSLDSSHDASLGQSLIEVGFLGAVERPMGVGTINRYPWDYAILTEYVSSVGNVCG